MAAAPGDGVSVAFDPTRTSNVIAAEAGRVPLFLAIWSQSARLWLLNAVTFLVEDMNRSEFIKPLGGLAADGGSFDERSEEWLTPVNRAFS
jgi:hypothetical protein